MKLSKWVVLELAPLRAEKKFHATSFLGLDRVSVFQDGVGKERLERF